VSFGHVVAPFDGRITQRNIDVGSLVTAGAASGASSGQPMFRIEAVDPIRVFVQVPQRFRRVTRAFTAASNRKREDLMDLEGGHDETAGLFVEVDVGSGRGIFGIDPGAGGAKGLCGWGRSTQ
jgi:multidrug efflux pump subunit AcrA (membrane-fusion protein)